MVPGVICIETSLLKATAFLCVKWKELHACNMFRVPSIPGTGHAVLSPAPSSETKPGDLSRGIIPDYRCPEKSLPGRFASHISPLPAIAQQG